MCITHTDRFIFPAKAAIYPYRKRIRVPGEKAYSIIEKCGDPEYGCDGKKAGKDDEDPRNGGTVHQDVGSDQQKDVWGELVLRTCFIRRKGIPDGYNA